MIAPPAVVPTLPPDVQRKILATSPLREFQRLYEEETEKGLPHMCSFEDRYWIRYGKKLPDLTELVGPGFSEEDRYLFFAGYSEEPEVGYKSQLFLDDHICVLHAVKEGDAELAKYFLGSNPPSPVWAARVFPWAVKRGLVEIINLGEVALPDTDSDTWLEVKVCWRSEPLEIPQNKKTQILAALLRQPQLAGEATFVLYRDHSLPEILALLVQCDLGNLQDCWADVVYGLFGFRARVKAGSSRRYAARPDLAPHRQARIAGALSGLFWRWEALPRGLALAAQ
jgi:hypothetical protein